MFGRSGVIATLLFLCACGQGSTSPEGKATVLVVRLAQVRQDQAPAEVSAIGTVTYRIETPLSFNTSGPISEIRVREGDRVRAGQRLAALEPRAVEEASARAGAERDRALAELKRNETLFASGWVSKTRVDSVRAAYLTANAQLRAASFQRRTAVAFAPDSGVILARLAEPGQIVSAGTPVLLIGEEGSGHVFRAMLTDREAARISFGSPARVRIDAIGPEPIIGTVVEIGARADQQTGTFSVSVRLPQRRELRSGQPGRAFIGARTQQALDRVLVPHEAVFAARAGEAFVWVYDPRRHQVSLRRVGLDKLEAGAISITSGLRLGEWLAVSKIERLRNGMTVQPVRSGG